MPCSRRTPSIGVAKWTIRLHGFEDEFPLLPHRPQTKVPASSTCRNPKSRANRNTQPQLPHGIINQNNKQEFPRANNITRMHRRTHLLQQTIATSHAKSTVLHIELQSSRTNNNRTSQTNYKTLTNPMFRHATPPIHRSPPHLCLSNTFTDPRDRFLYYRLPLRQADSGPRPRRRPDGTRHSVDPESQCTIRHVASTAASTCQRSKRRKTRRQINHSSARLRGQIPAPPTPCHRQESQHHRRAETPRDAQTGTPNHKSRMASLTKQQTRTPLEQATSPACTA